MVLDKVQEILSKVIVMIMKIFTLLLLLIFINDSEEVTLMVRKGKGILGEDGSVTCVIDPPQSTIIQVEWEFIRSDGTNLYTIYTYSPPTDTRTPQGNLVGRSSYTHNDTTGESTLIIYRFNNTDQGNYSCTMRYPATLTATNETIIYSRAGYSVNTDPPHHGNTIRVKKADNVTISAQSNCSKPPLEFIWLNQVAQDETRPCTTETFPGYGQKRSSLTFHTNANTRISFTARHPTFLADQPTTFTVIAVSPQVLSVIRNLEIILDCSEWFDPLYQTEWFHVTERLTKTKLMRWIPSGGGGGINVVEQGTSFTARINNATAGVCVIKKATPADNGSYECRAANGQAKFFEVNIIECLPGGHIAGCVVGYLAGGVLIVCLIVFAVKKKCLSSRDTVGIVIGCLAGVALFIALTVFGANRKCLSGGEIAGFVIGCLAGCVPSVCLIVFAVKKWTGTAKGDKNHADQN